GRGAFEVAFPAVRLDAGYKVMTHPENLVVQWVTEWGLPAAMAGGAAVMYALRPKVLLVSSTPALGAWAAIAATVVQNLVDFSSEVPAVGISVAVCAAMVVAGRGNSRPGRIHRWAMHPRSVAIGIAAASLASVAVAIIGWPHELDEERRSLYHRARTAEELRP